MTLRVLVFAEDRLGAWLARDLCDRIVIERGPTWLADLWRDQEIRETQRMWSGIEARDDFAKLGAEEETARGARHAHGLGMKGYELLAYKTAHRAARQDPPLPLMVICCDTDGDDLHARREQMRSGIEKARVEELRFALAIAHQEAEAWVVAGFHPESAQENELLRDLAKEHGFSPTEEPHRLTAGRKTDPHDAKGVSERLFADGTRSPRAEKCWLDTPLKELERRGAHTGLPEFLNDIVHVVLPLLGAERPAAS